MGRKVTLQKVAQAVNQCGELSRGTHKGSGSQQTRSVKRVGWFGWSHLAPIGEQWRRLKAKKLKAWMLCYIKPSFGHVGWLVGWSVSWLVSQSVGLWVGRLKLPSGMQWGFKGNTPGKFTTVAIPLVRFLCCFNYYLKYPTIVLFVSYWIKCIKAVKQPATWSH